VIPSVNGFNQDVGASCDGTPTNVTCSLVPASIQAFNSGMWWNLRIVGILLLSAGFITCGGEGGIAMVAGVVGGGGGNAVTVQMPIEALATGAQVSLGDVAFTSSNESLFWRQAVFPPFLNERSR
jgi:hypothetical protein